MTAVQQDHRRAADAALSTLQGRAIDIAASVYNRCTLVAQSWEKGLLITKMASAIVAQLQNGPAITEVEQDSQRESDAKMEERLFRAVSITQAEYSHKGAQIVIELAIGILPFIQD